MITVKSQFVQHALTAVTLFLVLGALSMIWPIILAIFLAVLMLFQSCCAEPEVAVLSWTWVGHVPIVVASLWGPGLPVILS